MGGGVLVRTCTAFLSVKVHTDERGWSYTIIFGRHVWKSKAA